MADSLPATFGGSGWQPRTREHRDELGAHWTGWSVDSEVAQLRAVLLAWPPDSLDFSGDPNRWLMLRRPHLQRMRAEYRMLVDRFESLGVAVHTCRPAVPMAPNSIFLRDLFFMTPEGAVLARPAAEQRAGEERGVAEVLAALGVPIVASFRGDEVFEGADALWLRPDLVAVGTGLRTNAAAFRRLAWLLGEMGVRAVEVAMPENGVQHLLGVVNPIAPDLAALRPHHACPELVGLLGELGVSTIELEESDEVSTGGGMNFVTLAQRTILLPGGCASSRARYEAHGVEVHEAAIDEYLSAAGGLGCLTGILHRG